MTTPSAPRPRRIYGRERLSRLLTLRDTRQPLQKATIRQINADGTVDLELADGVRAGVEVGSWYAPSVGDAVRVVRTDPFSLFVLGTTRGAAPSTITVANSILVPYNVSHPLADAPAPEVERGTNYFLAGSARSYRSPNGWERSEVYQGAYSSYQSSGFWSGCYFYGTAPQRLKGKRVTSASIRIHRKSTGGGGANVAQYIAPHSHYSRPSGAPYFTAGAKLLGRVDWGQALELPLPVAWAQALIDGKATVRGFGHRYSGYTSYSIAESLSSDAQSGRLTIRWVA